MFEGIRCYPRAISDHPRRELILDIFDEEFAEHREKFRNANEKEIFFEENTDTIIPYAKDIIEELDRLKRGWKPKELMEQVVENRRKSREQGWKEPVSKQPQMDIKTKQQAMEIETT